MKKIKELYDELLKEIQKTEGSTFHLINGSLGLISGIIVLVIVAYLFKQLSTFIIILCPIYVLIIWGASKRDLGRYSKPFLNNFVMLSIILFGLIIVFGTIGILSLYGTEYPDKILGGDNEVVGTCYGNKYQETHVRGDTMMCTINLSNLRYDKSFIPSITAIYDVNYNVDTRKEETIGTPLYSEKNKILYAQIPLKYSGINLIYLTIHYNWNGSSENISPIPLQFNVLTLEEYNKRLYEKVGLIALILSLAATVPFSGVRSFMEIWESAKQNQKTN